MQYSNKSSQEKGTVEHHHSDGSELVPAEVQARTHEPEERSPHTPISDGYTVDDEGILNNYGVEPKVSLSEYPSPQTQKQYVWQGLGAILFVVLIVLIAISVS
jgi:hypothetical protein